ncbi:MAG: serine--tRNA ligase [Candidatus Thermoplasmatota archaeon]|nr:serine--tRNA ligase [Euryarchaeota archaeon]MBU4032855.1 serine--tRNA ligase [Candidatus Thermoplasmatota archaeon]MBU4071370.1 serine--tRNA ligase [Candidatus Thermoplasmatota archaeon]MBU4144915.1 serine--tRNA ligase [Candidatus Thermoplasmatota archaeon]MBU4591503.1 serine--tRNA ligase [Candidatus Thermoplasmatota archaeon]
MLDIKLIRESPDLVRDNLRRRADDSKMQLLEELIQKDQQWRKSLERTNALKAERNTLSKQIAETKKSGDDASELMARSAQIPKDIATFDSETQALKTRVDEILMSLPNLLHESVPVGADDTANQVVRIWGKPREIDFELKSHGSIAESLGLADFDRAARISGAGFYYLKGDLALLDMALVNYAVNFLVERKYTLIEPPFMMRRSAYEGVTDLGDFEQVMYKIDGEDLYLIATAEHPMAAMFMDEIIDVDTLPLKFVGFSPCFRREIGAHGVDTKGIYRVHQFNKVEQFIFCNSDDSWTLFEELQGNTEAMFQALGLPYRVVNVCTSDIGTLAAKKYDIEVWFPRQGKFGEVTSCSNDTDYQARRLNIRCGKHGSDNKSVPHTLNNTAIATSRAMVAILENYQNADGTVTVPEVLRPYMGGKAVLSRP